MENRYEDGVSVYLTPVSGSWAGYGDGDWYFGKGRQVGFGGDDEPTIVPVGKWNKWKPNFEQSASSDSGGAEQTASPGNPVGQDVLFAAEKKPQDDEPTKIAPNVTRSAAILAAAKVLKTQPRELFDAPAAESEVPLRVSAAAMKEALDQVGRDWQLDPAALEKYRAPVEAAARSLLAKARRAGSFDAALASLQETPRAASTKQTIRSTTESKDPDKIILSAKDAVRQAMRLREQGRSEGMKEAVRLRQQFIQEASKYLKPEERGMVMKDLAGIGNEADLYHRLQRVYTAFDRAQKYRAVEDVRNLLNARDMKYLRPEFRKAMEAITGDLDAFTPSEQTQRRAEGLMAHLMTLGPDERAEMPEGTHALLERMGKQSLDSFSVQELQDMGRSIRAIVAQNQLKNVLIVGQHLRDLRKAESETVAAVKQLHPPLEPQGKPGEAAMPGEKSLAGKAVAYTSSPEVLAVDAGGAGGELHQHLYDALRKAENEQTGIKREKLAQVRQVFSDAGMDQSKIIDWQNQTRKIALADLPEQRAGGFDALDAAERKAQSVGGMLGDESALDGAARAAGESITPGTGGTAVEAARAARRGTPSETEGPIDETSGGKSGTTTPAGETTTGRSIELTGPEIASIFALTQNEGSRTKLLENKVLPRRMSGQSAYNRTLTPEDLDAITATMTPMERKLGELALKFGREDGEGMSKTWLALKGYELPLEENYSIGLQPDRKQANLAVNEMADVFSQKWMEDQGFLKARVPHRLPIMVPDLLEAMLEGMDKSSSFITKAVPVRNARMLLGSKNLRETLDGHVGRDFVPSMERLLRDFSGVDITPRTGYEKAASKLARNLAVATLGLRPTTVAMNFFGPSVELMTQMNRAEAKVFARKFINLKANTLDADQYLQQQISPHSPYLAERFDPHAEYHRQVVAAAGEGGAAAGSGLPTSKSKVVQKWHNFQEWSMSFINKGERAGIVAAHRALTEMYPESSPAEIADRLERMVRRTQNAVSSIDMSSALRDAKRNPVMSLSLMFTNQIGKLRDTAHLAILDYRRSGRTAQDKATLAAKMGLVATSASVVPLVIRGIWGQVRSGGREDEDKRDKSAWEHVTGVAADLADVVHPWVGDTMRLVTNSQGGFGQTTSNRALAQVAQGLDRLYQVGAGTGDPLEKAYGVVAALSRGVGALAGVPIDAPLSALEGVGKAVVGRPEEFGLQQEAARLRRQRPKGTGIDARMFDASGDGRLLRKYDSVLGRVGQIRKMLTTGKIEKGRANRVIQQLLAVAGRTPASAQ